MNVFDYRDAFADTTATPSTLRFESGPAEATPTVTIAIPTFRRPALLMETVESALAQRTDVPLEVVIVDNDPDSEASERIAATLPTDPPRPLRYFVNAENIGMYSNWNRCIELARGEWVSVLNDDDLLKPGFVERTIALTRRRPEIDGVVARTGMHDRRANPFRVEEGWLAALARRGWQRITSRRYDEDGLVRVEPKALFFGNEASSTLAFLFRRDVALALGGFRPEDWPSADYLFYARFAAAHGLYLLRERLGLVGIGENESLNPTTIEGFMIQGDRLRRSLAGREVPADWLTMSPLIVSTAIAESEKLWRADIDRERIEATLDLTLPPPSRAKLNLLRLWHGAV